MPGHNPTKLLLEIDQDFREMITRNITAENCSLQEYSDCISNSKNKFQTLLLEADANNDKIFFNDNRELILTCYERLNQIQKQFFAGTLDDYIGLGIIDGIIIRRKLHTDVGMLNLTNRIYDAIDRFMGAIPLDDDYIPTAESKLRIQPYKYFIEVFGKIFQDTYIVENEIYNQSKIPPLCNLWEQFILLASKVANIQNIRAYDTLSLKPNGEDPSDLCHQDEVTTEEVNQFLEQTKKQITKINICLYSKYYKYLTQELSEYLDNIIPTSFVTIEEMVSLESYPEKIMPLHPGDHLTIGDMHGNVIKLIYFLIKHGIIRLTSEEFAIFLNLYKEFSSNKQGYIAEGLTLKSILANINRLMEAKDYYAESKIDMVRECISILKQHVPEEERNKFNNMTIPEQLKYLEDHIAKASGELKSLNIKYKIIFENIINKFKKALESIEVTEVAKSNDVLIRFLGDIFADRGVSDLLTLFVLNILEKAKVNFEILIGNHDLIICANELFKPSSIKCDNFPGMLLNQCGSYQEGLNEIVNIFEVITKEEVKKLLKSCLLDKLNIISYDVEQLLPSGTDTRKYKINIYSHAIIDFETLINMVVTYPTSSNLNEEAIFLKLIKYFAGTTVQKQKKKEIIISLDLANIIKMLNKIRAVFREFIEKDMILDKLVEESNGIAKNLKAGEESIIGSTMHFMKTGSISRSFPYLSAMFNRCYSTEREQNHQNTFLIRGYKVTIIPSDQVVSFFVHGHNDNYKDLGYRSFHEYVVKRLEKGYHKIDAKIHLGHNNLNTELGKADLQKNITGLNNPGRYMVVQSTNLSVCVYELTRTQKQNLALLFKASSSHASSSLPTTIATTEDPPIDEADVSYKKMIASPIPNL